MKTNLSLAILLLCASIFTVPANAQDAPTICEAAPIEVTVSGAWTQGAPMPSPRSELGAAAADGIVYVGGGLADGGISDAFEAYHVADDTWTQLAPLPVALHHFGIAALDGKIYVMGGYADMAFSPAAGAWVYDPTADAWTQLNNLPEPIGAHQLVNVDDTLYIVGGVPDGTTLWKYDAAADTWDTALAPMPTAREHLGAIGADGRLFVVGGRWTRGNLAIVEAYDPATNTWDTLPEMPTARGGYNVTAIDDHIYATGGEDFIGTSCTFNRAEVYDVESQTWQRLPDMPTPRHGLTMAAVDRRWIVIGGATGAAGRTFQTTTSLVEIFTPQN